MDQDRFLQAFPEDCKQTKINKQTKKNKEKDTFAEASVTVSAHQIFYCALQRLKG